MKRQTLVIPVMAFLMAISVSLIVDDHNSLAAAYPYPLSDGTEEYRFGIVSSVQNDENHVPSWIVSGNWKSNLLANQSVIENQGNETYPGSSFNTQFEMVRLDGSGAHTHTITNFVASNSIQIDNATLTFNGTATASLREGPVIDIPTSISIIEDKVISIWLDPSKINNHYGNMPIYGLVMNDPTDQQELMKFNGTQRH
jgi:hypothetical protein